MDPTDETCRTCDNQVPDVSRAIKEGKPYNRVWQRTLAVDNKLTQKEAQQYMLAVDNAAKK